MNEKPDVNYLSSLFRMISLQSPNPLVSTELPAEAGKEDLQFRNPLVLKELLAEVRKEESKAVPRV